MRMRDVAEPIPCRECNGEGGHPIWLCGHHGNCPCDPEMAPCDRCDGTGEEPCSYCCGAPAVATYDGDAICAACAVIVARESEKAA